MNFDENKTFAELAIDGIQANGQNRKTDIAMINQYLLNQLNIESDKISKENQELLLRNFVHLMCLVMKDIKSINERLGRYKAEYHKYENIKTNKGEYYKRKLEYFSSINKNALTEIITFLQNDLKDYLMENKFDTLEREQNGDGLSDFYMKRRYKAAQFPEYYDIDFDFSTVVKTNYLPNVELIDMIKVEREYLELYKNDKETYFQKLHDIVDQDDVMTVILYKVAGNYHMNKRTQIFQDLEELFNKKHYQSFMSLGLLQLEGLFSDLCEIKYGAKENMGTLVEKVQKSLDGKNEFSFMRFYPYFAFDIPIQRNEIAHTGMIEADDLEKAVYNLILDINTVVTLVKSESFDKFIVFAMTHENMLNHEQKKPEFLDSVKEVNHLFITELIQNTVVANEDFWEVLKNPANFEEEMKFYEPEQLEKGHSGLSGIVNGISAMVYQKGFWEELLDILKMEMNQTGKIPDNLYSFAKRMKNDYIGVLTEEAKSYCIEIAKMCK